MPSFDDDEPLGYSFFRGLWEDADFSNFTIPRTYFGRSGFTGVTFANTNLSESRMCWNDFIACDFSGADLSRCDLRASTFERCRFVGAVLADADLRQAAFDGCDFTGAILDGAIAGDGNHELCKSVSDPQHDSMQWRADPGPSPPGG
jgi:uncharacterized protein YjbI with pentapeptide repeats